MSDIRRVWAIPAIVTLVPSKERASPSSSRGCASRISGTPAWHLGCFKVSHTFLPL